MDFEQIRRKATERCFRLNSSHGTRIYISSVADNPIFADLWPRLRDTLRQKGTELDFIASGSTGLYDLEPLVILERPGKPAIIYPKMTLETALSLIDDYLNRDNFRPDLALCSLGGGRVDNLPDAGELSLFRYQSRVATRNCGRINPEDISEYILRDDGYRGLCLALSLPPGDVIEIMEKTGQRGRNGEGRVIAEKWRTCRDADPGEKYVICNGLDVDPLARTARLLFEGDPHSVLEGMLIAGYATGARHGFICLGAGQDAARKRIIQALDQMKQFCLIGNNILGSDFSLDIEIKELAPSLVMGEDTAIIRFLEGKQPIPYLSSRVPEIKGLWGRPTLVHDVETLAILPPILKSSGNGVAREAFSLLAAGKVVTLGGMISHSRTVEVPLGTRLATIIYDLGGGLPAGRQVKALQFGGPAGGYLTAKDLNMPLEYEALKSAGLTMGSGTILLYDASSCAVEMARDTLAYLHEQSCGKCVFCREGTIQMLGFLQDISDFRGKPEHLDFFLKLGEAMKEGSICGLGMAAPDPVLSGIRLFRQDYEMHLINKMCPVKRL